MVWAGGVSDELFLGNALNGIDAKNRVSIPSSFREVLAARSLPAARTIILAPAEGADCLVGYDQSYPARARADLETRFAGDYGPDRQARFRAAFGAAEKVQIDDNGRIILSATMKDIGDIDRAALFWGTGDTFEVWNPASFMAQPDLEPRFQRIVQRLLDARGPA